MALSGSTAATILLTNAAYSSSIASSHSEMTPYGPACPNLIGGLPGTSSTKSPARLAAKIPAASSTCSPIASASAGLSRRPVPVERQIPSTGSRQPSQVVHGGAPSSAPGGNCTYREA